MADIKRFSFDCGKNLSSVPDLFDWKDFKVGDQKDMFSAQDVCTTKGKKKFTINEGKSIASFCRQMATWFPDMFCNFYLVKNHKIAENLVATKS